MQGQILVVEENKGIILGKDGKRYIFEIEEFKEKIYPIKGMKVDFEIENNKAKNIYLLEIPKPDILSVINLKSNTKIFGGIGSLFFVFSWIPHIGVILYLLGLIFLSIALNNLSKKCSSKGIIKNWIFSIFVAITSWILIYIIIINAIINSSDILLFLAYLVFITSAIIEGILYKKIFLSLYELTNETLFKTTANIFFWSGILSIILIGGILFFIGWILSTISFFSIKIKR